MNRPILTAIDKFFDEVTEAIIKAQETGHYAEGEWEWMNAMFCIANDSMTLPFIKRQHGPNALTSYTNEEHARTRNFPADQGDTGTCYAYAAATVIHKALIRIVGREGGIPPTKKIRERILRRFPPTSVMNDTEDMLKAVTSWYRPLRFRKVNQEDARQAVLEGRPVLTDFSLSDAGWRRFSEHFNEDAPARKSVLTRALMAPYWSSNPNGSHVVVLVNYDSSLTFQNSWGKKWGNNGRFSIEDETVLRVDGHPMCFYDVYWLESDLTAGEQEAYDVKVSQVLRARVDANFQQQVALSSISCRCRYCQPPLMNLPLSCSSTPCSCTPCRVFWKCPRISQLTRPCDFFHCPIEWEHPQGNQPPLACVYAVLIGSFHEAPCLRCHQSLDPQVNDLAEAFKDTCRLLLNSKKVDVFRMVLFRWSLYPFKA